MIRIPLGALLLVAAFCAHTAEPWKRLPPTPTMPPHTVGKHVTVNGARLWYAEWSAGNPGTPVLLLHGGYANSNYFALVLPKLSHFAMLQDPPAFNGAVLDFLRDYK